MRYTVEYRNTKTDNPTSRPFSNESEAMVWAREFVRESYSNQATAICYADGNPEPIHTYRNVNGKAVRS